MWSQIVGVMVLLVTATIVIQLFLPRSSGSRAPRTSVRWDVAPVVGFLGLLLFALSLTEAVRRMVFDAWAWGTALGVIASIVLWIALSYRGPVPVQKKGSALIASFRFLRAYGMPMLFASIGVYLAVRVFGSAVEVFIAGAAGVLIMTMAARVFVVGRPSTNTR